MRKKLIVLFILLSFFVSLIPNNVQAASAVAAPKIKVTTKDGNPKIS